MDIQAMIITFTKLSTQDKQEKLISMLDALKDSDVVFSSLLEKVSTSEPQDATLTVMYYDVMMFGQAIEAYQETKNITMLNKSEQYMNKLLAREQQERLENDKDIKTLESLLETI